jgi:hypothetical protein
MKSYIKKYAMKKGQYFLEKQFGLTDGEKL